MRYLIILFVILANISLLGFDANSEFKKGVEFYKNEDYSKASVVFEQLISEGYKNHEVYYNLGNCYFRTEKISLAILNYERAKRLAPSDEDIDFNLKIANLKIVDKYEPLPKIFFFEWYENFLSFFYSGTWSIIFVVSIWILCLSIATLMFFSGITIRKFAVWIGLISIIVILISGFFSYKSYNNELAVNSGIIFTQSVYIKSSPDNNSADLFILHEGTKVKILDEIGEWCEIRIDNGNVGWLPKKTVVVI